ncbi:MAG: copper oxidase [Leeuwenhoekiella sp.]|uniref:multicopper oxidase domain-containing protein n=2 Tax=Flavobacteriaceae TaxID=49546 RepID=UPI0005501E9E|nr:multicopper oxidase domain-containing protein [Leeuwenhoekiella sp. UBA6783]MBH13018.1 copper oxidase [Leeuwenhoekiella sp.]MCT8338959.1 multicopper oxidase domain-containing protein [Thermobacterium salinum]HBO29579.1 copper oxidase [Leeuwenhoekiella sp.]|tara:strand:+ start:6974 stop:9319 length:2346 start_codon:yes stop_codon:yes gene_type:complete
MNSKILILLMILVSSTAIAQTEPSVEGNVDNLPVREYTLTLREELVNKADKEVMGMTINGQIPGPTLNFNEGEYAVIYVKNEMSVESSIHWHGLLLPNFYDGVPYLSTPPIEPGKTLKYEFAIKQNGTYWYHSHTMLQEQSGIYGPFVIQPKEKTDLEYDKELVLLLSDWTNEKPRDVQRFLKRGTEWYNIRKGTATPLNQVIARGALGAQVDFWRQRMEGADIADIYYPAFLINGEEKIEYPEFKPGEKVRLRIIDGSASTSFWMTFGGEDPLMVAADGKDVVPVRKNKTFIGVAETYDFIVTIPDNGKLEYKIMAQDGSGTATAYLGQGEVIAAPDIPRPDKIAMMQQMAKMKMKMGAPALKFRPRKDERYEMKEKWGMQKSDMTMGEMEMEQSAMKGGDKMKNMSMEKPKDSMQMDHSKMGKMDKKMDDMKMDEPDGMQGMNMFSEYNYDYLKSPEKTNYDPDVPVTEILLNLTGNMQRYIWSLNGVPLSEADKIKIKGDEVTRITFNNLTMMHHPMHLHGHFFRVINENGEYSPLKHTVNVPPMQEITIEFYGNEYGDWFFHCHILYHMMGGMARIVSYDTPRDPRLEEFPVSKLIHETDQFYSWGMVDAASHMTTLNLVSSNIRNQFSLRGEYGWNKNMEVEVAYDRYLYDYLTVFGGINIENGMEDSLDEITTTAIAGIRYLTPYLFTLDVRTDSKLRPQISLSRAISIFPRTIIFGMYEYQMDFGWVDDLPQGVNFKEEVTWSAGVEYLLSKNFSLMGSYDNRFGAGGGLSLRF